MNLFLSLSFSLFVLLSLARHDFRKITRAAIGLNPERIVGTCTGPCGRYVYKGEPGAMCFECRQLPLEEVQRIEKEKKEAEEQRARDEAAQAEAAARRDNYTGKANALYTACYQKKNPDMAKINMLIDAGVNIRYQVRVVG